MCQLQAGTLFPLINPCDRSRTYVYCAVWGASASARSRALPRNAQAQSSINDSQTMRSSRTQPGDAACNINPYDGLSFAASLKPNDEDYRKICHTPAPCDRTPFFTDLGEAAATRHPTNTPPRVPCRRQVHKRSVEFPPMIVGWNS